MKNDTLKNIVMYALAAISAFFMSGGLKQCNGGNGIEAPAAQSAYEADLLKQIGSLTDYNEYILKLLSFEQQNVKVVTKVVTLHDRVGVPAPVQVDTPVLILWADEYPFPDSLRLYEGEMKGDSGRCNYRYIAGVQGDSLYFIAIESECRDTQDIQQAENPFIFPLPPLSDVLTYNGDSRFQVGAKTGWSPGDGSMMFGAQGAWRSIYAGANYIPAHKAWMIEAGFLLPIGPKKMTSKAPVNGIFSLK